jgi:hypothetical protein
LLGVSGYREVKFFSVGMMTKLFTTCKEDFFDVFAGEGHDVHLISAAVCFKKI